MKLTPRSRGGEEDDNDEETHEASRTQTNNDPNDGEETRETTIEQEVGGTRSLLFSGLYHGYYELRTKNGQNYFEDLHSFPNEDSSWFDEMIQPLEVDEVTHVYPMQGSNWGNIR